MNLRETHRRKSQGTCGLLGQRSPCPWWESAAASDVRVPVTSAPGAHALWPFCAGTRAGPAKLARERPSGDRRGPRACRGQARASGRLANVAPRSSRLATVAPRSSSYGDRRGPRACRGQSRASGRLATAAPRSSLSSVTLLQPIGRRLAEADFRLRLGKCARHTRVVQKMRVFLYPRTSGPAGT